MKQKSDKIKADGIVFERRLRMYGREDYITEYNLQVVIEGLLNDAKELQNELSELKLEVKYLIDPS